MLRFIDFSFIHPKSPFSTDEGETLYLEAVFSKPIFSICSLINLISLSMSLSWFFSISISDNLNSIIEDLFLSCKHKSDQISASCRTSIKRIEKFMRYDLIQIEQQRRRSAIE